MNSKIPDDAKVVFSGKIWGIYHWKEKLPNGSEEIFEGIKRKSTVRIIAVSNKKIIFAKEYEPNGTSFYNLLGGRIENGEEPLSAAKRELLEESGFSSENWQLLEVVDVLKMPRIEFYSYLFLAKDCKKISEQKLEPREKIEVIESDFEEFLKKIIKTQAYAGYEEKLNKLLNELL